MEFHTVRNEPRRLVLTAKQWITRMNAIGITSHAGRYGGTYFARNKLQICQRWTTNHISKY